MAATPKLKACKSLRISISYIIGMSWVNDWSVYGSRMKKKFCLYELWIEAYIYIYYIYISCCVNGWWFFRGRGYKAIYREGEGGVGGQRLTVDWRNALPGFDYLKIFFLWFCFYFIFSFWMTVITRIYYTFLIFFFKAENFLPCIWRLPRDTKIKDGSLWVYLLNEYTILFCICWN